MIMLHPGPASIDCEDCKRHIYNLESGQRETYKAGPNSEERSKVRHPGMPMQCPNCPKGSPDDAKVYRLSDRNWQTVELYKQIRITGMTDEMRQDGLLCANMAIVDEIFRQCERSKMARQIATEISNRVPLVKVG